MKISGSLQVKFSRAKKRLSLSFFRSTCGKSAIPVATVGIKINGEVHTSTASGNGPIDAAFTAVKHLISKTVHLEEFLIQAITKGSDDIGKVHIQLEHEGNIYIWIRYKYRYNYSFGRSFY